MKKWMIISVLLLIIIWAAVIMNQMKYTSFEEVVLQKLNINELESVYITRFPDPATVTLRDKNEIKELLNEFSNVKLKEERSQGEYKYWIHINGAAEFADPNIRRISIVLYEDHMRITDSEHRTRRQDTFVVTNEVNYWQALESEDFIWEER
ncbi:hypothetical protein [Alkalihalobacterium chitinilyticum]|uniref:Uncharacterized protein n=1 Tax=Alkalihalobacterium chitinilyticum TaxID=2980103 RepID=A0ABT5VL09_9BACI|nr:hypothetical protein [Alkalihalobacterium chitinilyticum]MDE5415138.1 hypothetical protein [Alkalihalobacterium chitinilyticum]